MTNEKQWDREAAEGRLANITPGPWKHIRVENPLNDKGREVMPNCATFMLDYVVTGWGHPQLKSEAPIFCVSTGPYHEEINTVHIRPEDAEFIAHAPDDLRHALDLLREREQALVSDKRYTHKHYCPKVKGNSCTCGLDEYAMKDLRPHITSVLDLQNQSRDLECELKEREAADWRMHVNELGLVKVNCSIEEGLIPSERIVRLENADGHVEEVSVSPRNLEDGGLVVSAIGADKGRVLLELPRESASGRWRIWVKESAIQKVKRVAGRKP